MTALKRKAMAIAILFCCLFITFSSQSYVRSQSEQPSNQKYVSAESMQEYAQTIISTYNQNISGYFPKTTEGFSFYSNSSHYSIKAYISAQHGAALWIEPSITESFELTSVSDRIETAIFGGNWSTWAAFNGGFEVMISSLTLELNGHPLVNLPENSTLMLKDVFVNNTDLLQSYTCIILKGSNETKYWTPNWASYEANRIFEDDVRVSFTVSEEVRLRYAEPVLTARLKIIQEKLLNSSKQPYSYSDWLADMQEIEDIAKNQYHSVRRLVLMCQRLRPLAAQIQG